MEPTEVIDADRQASARPGGWRAHALWAGSVLGIFGLYLTWLSQTELPDGQCSGIGWGCSLAGWDAVGIAAVIYGVPWPSSGWWDTSRSRSPAGDAATARLPNDEGRLAPLSA